MCLNRQVTQTKQLLFYYWLCQREKSYEWKSYSKIKMNQEVIKILQISYPYWLPEAVWFLACIFKPIYHIYYIRSKYVLLLLFLYKHNETKHHKILIFYSSGWLDRCIGRSLWPIIYGGLKDTLALNIRLIPDPFFFSNETFSS